MDADSQKQDSAERTAWRDQKRRYRAGKRDGRPAQPGRPRKYPASWTKTDKARYLQFGVAPEIVAARLERQGGGCAICSAVAPKGRGDWHVDHDHTSGRVRGVLCAGCNVALGIMSDDVARLRAAAEYIERHRGLQALL